MKFLFKEKRKNNKKGFTLIEVVLVMFVVSLAFTGIYSILAKNSKHEKDNRYNLIAANLAQEGAEMVRNKRDENLLEGLKINDSLDSGVCYPYWDGSSARCNNSDKRAQIEIDNENVYRNCDSSGCSFTEAVFSRSCDIVSDDEVMEVECTVEWESPSLGIEKNIEIKSILTNWQENI